MSVAVSGAALVHATCGQRLRAATGGDGARLWECRACGCAVVQLVAGTTPPGDRDSDMVLAHYLAEKYEIEFLDAVGLVLRQYATVFGVIGRRESMWLAGDAMASLEGLRPRPV